MKKFLLVGLGDGPIRMGERYFKKFRCNHENG